MKLVFASGEGGALAESLILFHLNNFGKLIFLNNAPVFLPMTICVYISGS